VRPAIFVDRDGTIVRDTHYMNDPERIQLIEGAPSAIARLRTAGFAIVVVTNQSGIARGLITADEYEAVRARVESLMAAAGATLDATYMCPHHPDVTGPCDCRKPGSALFKRAAADLGIDLSRSVLIGDRWHDIEPARALGARGLLVPGPDTPIDDIDRANQSAVLAPSLQTAVDRILAG
jgi:histidinol-phosphate phosphatase family protein